MAAPTIMQVILEPEETSINFHIDLQLQSFLIFNLWIHILYKAATMVAAFFNQTNVKNISNVLSSVSARTKLIFLEHIYMI